MLHLEQIQKNATLGVLVTNSEGQIKDFRFARPILDGSISIEFVPNKRYINKLNNNQIEPGKWRIPFLYGSWRFITKGK